VAFAGLAGAIVFTMLVFGGRRLLAAVALGVTLLLLSYPFFAGLTSSGRVLFAFGVLFGLAAVPATRPRRAAVS
jgi:uncharacterized membrane protein